MRTRMRTIRPKLAAPDCHIERGPTSFLVNSPAGQATFRLGLGHGHAPVFSWVATASLASIAASYRDPDGRPVFSPSDLLPSPYERPPPSPYATEPAPTETDTASMVVQGDDPDLVGDLVVIDDFLAKDPLWSRRPGVDPLVLDIATFSTEWVLARTDSGYTIENRRSRNVFGTFSSARGARRYAIMELGRLVASVARTQIDLAQASHSGQPAAETPRWLPADVERWRSQVPDGLRRDQIQLDRHGGARRHRGQLQPPQR
jgi:hypothetical protein